MAKAKAKKTAATKTVAAKPTGRALAMRQDGNSIVFGNRKLTLARRVTLPTLRHPGGATVAFRVEAPMVLGNKIKGDAKEPATVVEVTNMANGMRCRYVVAAIIRRCWEDDYDAVTPENPMGKSLYVGKIFVAKKSNEETPTAAGGGRRYRQIEMVEVTDDGEVTKDGEEAYDDAPEAEAAA